MQTPYLGAGRVRHDGRLQIDSLLMGYDGGDLLDRPVVRRARLPGDPVHIASWPARQEFKAHYNQWLEDSIFDSLPDRMRRHESYRAIIELGDRVVPLIAAELRKEPSFVFLALEDIMQCDPVPEEAQGDLHATVAAWLTWLQK